MDFTFTATKEAPSLVPWYEDARADFAPYYRSQKTAKTAKSEVAAEMEKLGAILIAFREGYFGQRPKVRHGYEIDFLLGNHRGVLRVAGLPLRRETPVKVEQVRVQALLNVRDWLKVAVTQMVFRPGAGHPLLMDLLTGPSRTVSDYIISTGELPRLGDDESGGHSGRAAGFIEG